MTNRPDLSSEQDQQANLSVELQAAFGESVRASRLKAGLTQSELSDRAGVPREEISRIENGQINLTLRTMSKLASVLDADVGEMLLAKRNPRD